LRCVVPKHLLLFAFEPSTFTLLALRAAGPEFFLEFSDHSFKFGYETNHITDLLNSWGYVGRNWEDGKAAVEELIPCKSHKVYAVKEVLLCSRSGACTAASPSASSV
jgi:hypothetical protein